MGKYKHFAKNVSILAIAQFSSKFLSFLLVPIYTAYLDPEEYGTFDLIYAMIRLATPILSLSMTEAALRILMDKCDKKKECEAISISMYYIITGITIIGGGLLVEHLLVPTRYIDGFELYALLLYSAFVVNKAMMSFARGMTRVTDLGISGFIGAAITVGLNVYFLAFLRLGIDGYFIATILGLGTQALYLAIRMKIWEWFVLTHNKELDVYMRKYSIPVVFSSIGWWANSSADRFITSTICGTSENGLLSTAYKIPAILNAVDSVYNEAWLISAVKEYEKGNHKSFFNKMYATYVLLLTGICLTLTLFVRIIAKVMFSGAFYIAWQYVPIFLVASVVSAEAGFMGPVLVAKKDTKTMGRSAIASTLINIVLNIILALKFGVQGVAIATLVSAYVMYAMRFYAAKNDINISFFHKANGTIIMLFFNAVATLYCSDVVVRLIVFIAVVFLVFFMWRKQCKEILFPIIDKLFLNK